MIDEAPSWAAADNGTPDHGRGTVVFDSLPVEMHGVATDLVGARPRCQHAVAVHSRVIHKSALVGSPQVLEGGVADVNHCVVMEHNVPSLHQRSGLRLDDGISVKVGDVDLQVRSRNGMIEYECVNRDR